MTVDTPEELPAPSSGLVLEVSFRRLLASCQEIAAGDDKGRDDLKQWQTSPVFHHYIETLQEQLSDLETSNRIDPRILNLYKQKTTTLSTSLKSAHVTDLCRFIDALPKQSLKNNSPLILPPGTTTAATSSPLSTHQKSIFDNNNNRSIHQPQAPIAPPISVPKLNTTSTSSATSIKPITVSNAAKSRLQTQDKIQAHLTDELAEMASALKTNTKAVESKLKEREELLDSTEHAIEKSAVDTKAGVARTTAAHKRSRLNICFSCLVLLIIFTGFAAMFLFIRVTSFTGYTSRKKFVSKPVVEDQPYIYDDYGDINVSLGDDDQHIEL